MNARSEMLLRVALRSRESLLQAEAEMAEAEMAEAEMAEAEMAAAPEVETPQAAQQAARPRRSVTWRGSRQLVEVRTYVPEAHAHAPAL